jgi:hypothetical protein
LSFVIARTRAVAIQMDCFVAALLAMTTPVVTPFENYH